jgi:hypothetical protein
MPTHPSRQAFSNIDFGNFPSLLSHLFSDRPLLSEFLAPFEYLFIISQPKFIFVLSMNLDGSAQQNSEMIVVYLIGPFDNLQQFAS